MPSIALYYPWMHFQDDNWVKLALLTWDRIVRLRPAGVGNFDGDLVRQVRAETDFVVAAAPGPAELAAVEQSFTEIIDADPRLLLDRYGIAYSPREELDPRPGDLRSATYWLGYDPPVPQGTWNMVRSAYMLRMHTGGRDSKMTSALGERLVAMGLGERSSSPWVSMHPKLGSIYLAVLTDVMARTETLSPATDDLRMHQAVGARDQLTELLFEDRPGAAAVEDARSAYVHVALRAVLEPARLASVPVAKLIRFRESHRHELAAFHDHVEGLGAELRSVAASENVAVAAAHLGSVYERRTRPRLDELRRAMRAHGIESTAGTLVQKVDLDIAAGTALGSVAAAAGHLALAGAAVAVSLVPYTAGRFAARRRLLGESPVSYLLAADRELAATRSSARCNAARAGGSPSPQVRAIAPASGRVDGTNRRRSAVFRSDKVFIVR